MTLDDASESEPFICVPSLKDVVFIWIRVTVLLLSLYCISKTRSGFHPTGAASTVLPRKFERINHFMPILRL